MKHFILFILFIFLTACSEKIPFTVQTQKEIFITPAVNKFSTTLCGDQTIHKPKVDILFVIDNSTSLNQQYVSSELKQSIANVVSNISDNFDYHALIVPLLSYAGANQQLVVSNATGLGVGAPTPIGIDSVDVQQYLNNTQPGGAEKGFLRVHDVITSNITNGVFRKKVHTLVVMLSNGDDNDNITDPQTGLPIGSNYGTRYNQLISLTNKSGNTTLQALTLRFISVVPHTACQTGYIQANRYIQMSKDIYNFMGATDQGGNPRPDSYNICSNSITNVFTTISSVLPSTVVDHVYNYWPAKITNNSTIDFNENEIVVRKVTQSGIVNIPEDNVNGFQFLPTHQTLNIREYPAVSSDYPAEYVTGFFVQLHGNAKVTSPDCLAVQIQDPQEFFGYIVIGNNPDLNDTIIKKNGVIVNQSNTDGWSFQGFSPSQNIRIISETNHNPHASGVYKTGYVFKMNGSAVYSNEDIITVEYKQTGVQN